MRNVRVVSITLAITLFMTLGATGQQETLLVDLRIEPEHSERAIGLYDAARANNYPRFAQLYAETPHAEYAELHRLWSWSMTDPIGAFYGAEEYERLSRLYTGYRNYIERYRIVDSHGNVFYPSAETRRFLLGEAVMGTMPVARPVVRMASAPAPVPARREAPAAARTQAPHPPSGHLLPAQRGEGVHTIAQPVVVPASPPIVKAKAPEPERVRGAVLGHEAARGALSRSIFLMIAGLIGVGMLTLMLQAPRDEADRNLSGHTP